MSGEAAAESGRGAVLEVQLAGGVWYRGRLMERVAGSEPPRWNVQFDDTKKIQDIRLGDPNVRFDAGAYGATVEVRTAGEWRCGRLVELMRGGEKWGVAFEDGHWAEDVRLGDPDVRYTLAGQIGVKRGRGEDVGDGGSDVSRKKVGTAGMGRVRSRGLECETCGKAFSDSSTFAAHKRTHSGERPYICGTCGQAFSQSSNLAAHSRTHSGERPYVCGTCGKAFAQSSTLAGHVLTHSGERPCVCETCGKAFARSSNLAAHMRRHTEEKPYVCGTCGMAFSQSSNLAVHTRTHSREKPYICVTCGKAFVRSDGLVAHIRTHTGDRPYVCETCSKAFSESRQLAAHVRTHSGDKPFVCETCGKAFARSDGLTAHIRTHAGAKPSPRVQGDLADKTPPPSLGPP
jgi:DNA-directed RNA polymerase subunit RPC12/RpoP